MQRLEREKLKRLEKRRLKGIALLKKGYTCYGVSKELGVRKQSVMRWRDKYESEGIEGVKWNGQRGRPTKLKISEKKELKGIILKGPTSCGYPNELWSTYRVSEIIRKKFGVTYHQDYVGTLLHQLGFSYQKPKRRALERDEKAIETWKTKTWPDIKKAQNEGFKILFLDESGISQNPYTVKTWSLIGKTPILLHKMSWKKLSVIGAISQKDFHFQIITGSVKSRDLINFLKILLKENRKKILIVWDNLSAHKSKAMNEFLKENEKRLRVEFLPPYAPELNPQEYIWCRWKKNYMANFCPENLSQLIQRTRSTLRILKSDTVFDSYWM
ncbi:IS630 family transposase [Leptospira weilii]|uniref:IS630 family transposase n=1 Tax=Leptospira weilii TaxID=28184 RepID=UPI00256F4275|nr:IS630 family transposase [Leptospira weilii]MDL5246256.1 IS630 family transposase [Leptospira weilii]